MCLICLPILGPHCKFHEEAICPLQKAMNCSICGKGRHFMNACPLRSKSISSEYIPSIKHEAVNSYSLPNKNTVYIEYLRSRGQEFEIPIVRNRILVKEHLKKQGLILVNPIESHFTSDCGCRLCIKNGWSKIE